MHVVLLGYRASGKSTIAPRLAQAVGMRWVDSDSEIERRLGQPISVFFAEHGESAFRVEETAVIASLLAEPTPTVIATGGGCIETAEVRSRLHQMSQRGAALTIYLAGSAALLASRLEASAGARPSLTGKPVHAEVAEVLARRDPWYRAAAQATVTVDQPVERVVDALQQIVENFSKTTTNPH